MNIKWLKVKGTGAGLFFVFTFITIAAEVGVTNLSESVLTNAISDNPKTSFTLRWENDTVAGTDENYSNGISLSFSRRGHSILGKFWDMFGMEDWEHYYSIELGQIINTPSDTSRQIPDPNDRPYSGLLYLSLSTLVSKNNNFHGLKFVTGVVGPPSLAEETQKWWHSIVGAKQPQGWGYQLHTEPIFNFVYEYRYKYRLFGDQRGLSSEFIPVLGAMAGNVLVQGQVGFQTRIGWHIPDDFGTTLLRGMGNLTIPKYPPEGTKLRKLGFYVFGSAGCNGVVRNLMLEGNTFRDSPHVGKRPFVPVAEGGFSFYVGFIQATASYVVMGREFDTQPRISQYGSLYLNFFF